LTDTFDVALGAESAQVIAHGTGLEAQLLTLLIGHCRAEALRQKLHESQGTDVNTLGLLLSLGALRIIIRTIAIIIAYFINKKKTSNTSVKVEEAEIAEEK
jgi:hypothetical protein